MQDVSISITSFSGRYLVTLVAMHVRIPHPVPFGKKDKNYGKTSILPGAV
jgi:hypothetical protein